MNFGRIALTALLAAALAVSACGRKGEPVRPGSEKDPNKPAAATTN
jgi:predicted small lipoprotein YifL